jgi:pyruvate dehydrogenase E1 component beta subunit/2-oxoisovalerate dehydrogenase E1 component
MLASFSSQHLESQFTPPGNPSDSAFRKFALVIGRDRWRSGSVAAEVSARIMEEAFWELDAPVGRVCTAEVPIPYPRHLEQAALPQAAAIVAAVKAAMGR